MSASAVPAPLEARYVRARYPVQVTLHQPGLTENSPGRQITGQLLGEMRARGTLHHYRVAGDDGVLYFAPPSWLAPQSRLVVVWAGLTVPQSVRPGRWVATINALAEQWAALPDDHPILTCRRACVPVAPPLAEARPSGDAP
jgi:hypothetical protein